MNSKARITRFMQQHRQATRPQIAAALGLSLVSTNAAVAALEKEGVLFPGELVPSGGGRPVREYHFNPGHAAVSLITATPEVHCTLLRCELGSREKVDEALERIRSLCPTAEIGYWKKEA